MSTAGATDKARVAYVGDHDQVWIGQDGYCGNGTNVNSKDWKNVFVQGGQRTWIRLKYKWLGSLFDEACTSEYSFVSEAGKIYLVNHQLIDEVCTTGLYIAAAGKDPVQVSLTPEGVRSCLGK